MKNFIQPGENLTFVASSALVGGQGLLVGAIFGVVAGSVASGEEFVLSRKGVFELPKKTGAAWTVGQSLYWHAGTAKITTTATDAVLVGAAVQAADSAATAGDVLLDGAIR